MRFTAQERDLFLYGTEGDRLYVSYRNRMGRKRSYMTSFEGIVPNLERRYRETDSEAVREKIEEYMTMRPCPECKGARLRPEPAQMRRWAVKRMVDIVGALVGLILLAPVLALCSLAVLWESGLHGVQKLDAQKLNKTEPFKMDQADDTHKQHVRNFLDCVKSRKTPACPPEIGRATALHLHIANISARIKQPHLIWNESKNQFDNSKEANALITPEYRKPWTLPKI